MEFHLLPIHASFMLLVVLLFIHGYSLTADGSSSSDAGKSADGYNGVYGIPKQAKTSKGSSYGGIYGNPEKESRNSMNAPKNGYDAVYGTPQKTGGNYDAVYGIREKTSEGSSYDGIYGNPEKESRNSMNAPKNGYDAVYGIPQKTGGNYDAVYGIGEKTSEGSPYDGIYGNPEKERRNSMNAPKNGYEAVYGTPQKTGGNYDAVSGNSQQKTAPYDSIYGNSQQKTGPYDSIYGNDPPQAPASYDSIYGNSQPETAQYDSIYGGPQKTRGSAYGSIYGNPQRADKSSVSMAKNNPKMEQEHQDHGAGLNVFLEKDLHPGTKMVVHFTRTSTATHMLPRQVAESIPFSSNHLPEILKRFSVEENSAEAKTIEKTVKECEKPAIEGEDKYCARSVESLIEFSTSRLGKNNNIRVIPNVVEGKIQEYKFEEGVEMVGEESVVCHQLEYPHAVALCHVFPMTKIYRVPLVGTSDGVRVKALAVCHEDTSTWAPDALAFHLLKVEPGTLPICHFLRNGHFVWVPKQHKLYKKPSS